MKKKIFIGGIISLLLIAVVYFIFNDVRYNNISKIRANIINKAVITEKNDIKSFMKYINTKKIIKDPVFIDSTVGGGIDNNVIIDYKNGTSSSFFIGMNYVNAELTCHYDENTMIGYIINKENTKKILKLLKEN